MRTTLVKHGLGVCLMAAAASLATSAPALAQKKGADPVVRVEDANTRMNAAIANAQASLEVFEAAFAADKLTDDAFSVKVAIPTDPDLDGPTVEYIWVSLLTLDAGQGSGVLNNQPAFFRANRGDFVTFRRDQIGDWQFHRNGVRYGHFTTRVLLDHLEPDTAARIRATLSATPMHGL